jgi:bifunctional DNA-binding transcriptional regulator/antitoxin component of YhaV-PrlF toxin-antitoxin module
MTMTESPSFITTCTEDEEGNLVLNFPDELLEAMGWQEGTTLDISVVGARIVLREVIPGKDSEIV